MHGFVRNCLLAVSASLAFAVPGVAFAGTSGLYLPPAPSGSGGEDSIETSGGTRCRQSMNSNGTYLDVGMAGTAASPSQNLGYSFNDNRSREATAYVRMTIPIGRRPERIDCSRIYEMEIDKLRREVELLKLGAQ